MNIRGSSTTPGAEVEVSSDILRPYFSTMSPGVSESLEVCHSGDISHIWDSNNETLTFDTRSEKDLHDPDS